MANTKAPDALVLRVDKSSFHNFARLRSGAGELRIFVPYTSRELTRAALREAAGLVKNLHAHVTLFAVQIVPFLLPLDRPDVAPEFLEQRLMAIAREMEGLVDVQLICAREFDSGMERVLVPNSLVVLATKKRWWPTEEIKMARALARAGHKIALLEV